MAYEDRIMDELEECLSFEDIDENIEKIEELIKQESDKGGDAMRPNVLAETIKSYIFDGLWDDSTEELIELDEFEMEQQFC